MDPILRQGSNGNAVTELQQLLLKKGFYNGKIDGDFGVVTTNAVLKFQKANRLTTDGIVGRSSWTSLRAVSQTVSQTPVTTLPTLLPGSKGAAVTQAQQLLKAKGYYQGRIDGDFGMVTRDAIAAFQRANGLTVDGKVGEQTWKKLQAPAIADVKPLEPTLVIDIVRPTSSEPTPTTPTAPLANAPIPIPSSIFIPVSSPISTNIPATSTTTPASITPASIPTANAISLVDAANSYSRAKLSNQTAAINTLQASISPEILQQFLQRWQIASGQTTTATSLQDAFGSYNNNQMLNQNLALQWLQNQLLTQDIAKFRQDWSNLTLAVSSDPSFSPSQPTPPLASTQQLINLTDAVKVYDRTKFPNQVTALENLQASFSAQTMQQFFQRWALASEQNAIAISLLDIFQDYDSQRFPSQVTALQWLEKELTTAQLVQFSQDWQV